MAVEPHGMRGQQGQQRNAGVARQYGVFKGFAERQPIFDREYRCRNGIA